MKCICSPLVFQYGIHCFLLFIMYLNYTDFTTHHVCSVCMHACMQTTLFIRIQLSFLEPSPLQLKLLPKIFVCRLCLSLCISFVLMLSWLCNVDNVTLPPVITLVGVIVTLPLFPRHLISGLVMVPCRLTRRTGSFAVTIYHGFNKILNITILQKKKSLSAAL